MNRVQLTEDIAIDTFRSFFREKPFLFFGTGTSCALDTRFGMPALTDALISQISTQPMTGAQANEWASVVAELHNDSTLESALNAVNDQDLLRTITDITGAFVASIDREYACRIANCDVEWPTTSLLKKLVDTLPEGDRILHALTPNYDMLFEYACDCAGIPYSNGFSGGIEKKTDWDAIDRSMRLPELVSNRGRIRTLYKHRKHIRLYKVHGSLNYFFHRSAVIENNAWMWNPPDFARRVLITPGVSKYQTLQYYRQDLLKSADAAIEKASHFLFLGYGFNDNHLDEYIKRKMIAQGCKGLIITRDCNPRIEALLADAPNLWLVCQVQDPGSNGTRVYNRQYSDWLRLPARRLWDFGEFTKQILGG